MPIFQAKGPKIWTWRTLHVEKPADESVDLWIREIKNHGGICWKLTWIIIIFDNFDRSKVVRRDIFLNISNITAVTPQLKMSPHPWVGAFVTL